jgi:phosphate uptake regulator
VTIDGARPDPSIVKQLTTIAGHVMSTVELTLKALEQRNLEVYLEVVAADSSNDELYRVVFAALVDTASNGAARTWVLALNHVMRLYERAGDHAVDIAEAVWFQITGELREFGRDR